MSIARSIESLDRIELDLVESCVRSCEQLRLERVAATATRLGNGWLYPFLSLFVLAARIEAPLRFLASSAASLALAFAVYPVLKLFLARRRPCDYEPSLARELEPLDQYSCPSGHSMTAAAYGVPLLFAWPAAAPLAVALCVVIGWSRVATGHHYITDVVFGWLLGAAVSVFVLSVL
jgi:undecaprenyl-diphosphatase